jgi:hypothetical protein
MDVSAFTTRAPHRSSVISYSQLGPGNEETSKHSIGSLKEPAGLGNLVCIDLMFHRKEKDRPDNEPQKPLFLCLQFR